MALHMGWLVETSKNKYALGPTIRYKGLYKKQSVGSNVKPVARHGD